MHYVGRSAGEVNDEWVPIGADRVQATEGFDGMLDEEEEDSEVCEVCGSAEDSENLLLCDTEGCERESRARRARARERARERG